MDYSSFPAGHTSFGRGFLTSLPQAATPWLSIVYPFTAPVWAATAVALLLFVPLYVKVITFSGLGTPAKVLDWMAGVGLGRGKL